MKPLPRFLCLASLIGGNLVAAPEWKGWISDAQCGAGNASSEPATRECAKVCIKNGAKPVFVTETGGHVYQIAGKADIMAHLDHKVKVAGQLKGDTLTITAISRAE